MLKKLKLWLFPTTFEEFKFDAVDRDGDGLIQEGTPFERKIAAAVLSKKKPVKKTAKKPVKKNTKKKPVKKAVSKKPIKKTVSKTTKKK